MVRPALEVADILRDHGPAWREANCGHVSLEQLKVMSAIERCRTAALGGHVARCENAACGSRFEAVVVAFVRKRRIDRQNASLTYCHELNSSRPLDEHSEHCSLFDRCARSELVAMRKQNCPLFA